MSNCITWNCADRHDWDFLDFVERYVSPRPQITSNKTVEVKTVYKVPEIKEVIFNNNTTVLIWKDGEKTIVHLGEGETFDRYTGFMAAVCKKMFGGTTTAKKLMNSLDRKYQAALKAEKREKEKAKRIAEAAAAHERAEKRLAKEKERLRQELIERLMMEAEAEKIVKDKLNCGGDANV